MTPADPFEKLSAKAVGPTRGFRIWMAGDIEQAKQVCRIRCSQIGACFAIAPQTYIYSGGEEVGFCVTLINYPRFETEQYTRNLQAKSLAEMLMIHLNQGSFTIEEYGTVDATTTFYSRRKGD